jgi:hypothetical protein
MRPSAQVKKEMWAAVRTGRNSINHTFPSVNVAALAWKGFVSWPQRVVTELDV